MEGINALTWEGAFLSANHSARFQLGMSLNSFQTQCDRAPHGVRQEDSGFAYSGRVIGSSGRRGRLWLPFISLAEIVICLSV